MLRALAILVLLTGCSGSQHLVVCPRLPEYSREMQARVLEELPRLSPDVLRFIEDYGRLRAEVRALCSSSQ